MILFFLNILLTIFIPKTKENVYIETFDYPDGNLPEMFWSEGCQAVIQDGRLFVDADTTGYRASTIWLDKTFSGNVSIEFDACILSSKDSANNINFFFMYSDPTGKPLRQSARKRESGKYSLYQQLNGFIFTNVITTSDDDDVIYRYRFRYNPGFKIIDESIVHGKYIVDVIHKIRIVKNGNHFKCWVDGRKVIDTVYNKCYPVHDNGLIGVRTWHTSLWIDNLVVKEYKDVGAAMVKEKQILTRERLVSNEMELKTEITNVLPGETIVMQNRIWNNIDIILKGKGNKAAPITLRAETAGEVIITGNSSLRMSGEYLVVDGLHFKDGYSPLKHVIQFRDDNYKPANNSRVTNIAITSFNRADDEFETWVSLYGNNNRVDHCFFNEKVSAGRIINVWRPTDDVNCHQIDHNYFKDIPVLGRNGAEAVGVGYSGTSLSASHTIIEHNLFENCNGEGELIGIKSCENIIRYNTIIRSQGSISLRHGNKTLVEGNIILGENVRRTGGIRIMGEGHIVKNNYIQDLRGSRAALSIVEGIIDSPLHGYLQVKNVLIEGNILIDNELGLVVGELFNTDKLQTMPATNTVIKNNIIRGANDKSTLINEINAPINMMYQYNIVFNGKIKMADNYGIRIDDALFDIDKNTIRTEIVDKQLQALEVGPVWLDYM